MCLLTIRSRFVEFYNDSSMSMMRFEEIESGWDVASRRPHVRFISFEFVEVV